MSGARLKPEQRDLFLNVLDMLAAGTALLRGRVVAGGFAASVTDVLFGATASEDRLPAMAGELIRNLYRVEDAPRTYGAAARTILLEHVAVEIRRAEQAEEAAQAATEAAAENRKLRARAKDEAEAVKRRAERAQRKAAKGALREAA